MNAADMFAWLRLVQHDPAISAGAFELAFVVSQYANRETGRAWPTQTTLAREIGASDRTVRTFLSELSAAGFIAVDGSGGRHKSNIYQIVWPADEQNETRKPASTFSHENPEGDFHVSDEKPGNLASETRKNPAQNVEAGFLQNQPHELTSITIPVSPAADAAKPPAADLAILPPPDPKRQLFGQGLAILISLTSKSQEACKKLLGMWMRDAKNDAKRVMRAIEDARDERVADPVPWIAAALRGPRRRQTDTRSHDFVFGRH